jgi:hypothetical protein
VLSARSGGFARKEHTMDEQELATMLQAVDRQLRAVLVQVQAATEMARENSILMRETVARIAPDEPAVS